MTVTLPGIVTLVKVVLPANAPAGMLVTPRPKSMLVKPSQPVNASVPTLVTLSGTVRFVRPRHP